VALFARTFGVKTWRTPAPIANFTRIYTASDNPGRFRDIRHARRWCDDFFRWYNEQHHHEGLSQLANSLPLTFIGDARKSLLNVEHKPCKKLTTITPDDSYGALRLCAYRQVVSR